MNRDRIEMSQRERDRLKVMALVLEGKRTQPEAARLLKRCVRQVRRIQRRLEAQGDAGVIHRLRGHPSNRAKGDDLRLRVLARYRERYMGFGPTLAAEKLTAEGLPVSDETLRNWLLTAGLWERKRRRDKHRQRRDRRECFGELTQADGSEHDWLEGRGPRMVLLVMIDDATSKTVARFYPAETTEGYMDLLKRYVRKHGRMVAMYTDHDSVFCGECPDKKPAKTQFSRALEELDIGWIPAGSPQAKGRVERFNGTAQDRLVKELRLANACTMDQANEVLDKTFLPWFNRFCTVKPASGNNAHRPLHPSMTLGAILSIQDKRKVANDYTIRLDNQVYQLLKPALPGQRGGWVTVEKRLDGTLHIRFKNRYLAYHRIGPADRTGALPPTPRSLSLGQTPAERKEEGQAAVMAGPSAVRLTLGRSGRTPAEPCPPKGDNTIPVKQPYCRPPEHPWNKFRLRGSRPPKADISILAK
jgi:transposase InsO family protein